MSNREANPSPTSAGGDTEMVFIYTTPNFAESEIITDMFETEEIAYMERPMEIPIHPFNIGGHDHIRIAVEASRADMARKLIQQALVDEAIPGDGNFLES